MNLVLNDITIENRLVLVFMINCLYASYVKSKYYLTILIYKNEI